MARLLSRGRKSSISDKRNKFKPDINVGPILEFDSPGGHLIEVKILVNRRLVYGDSYVYTGNKDYRDFKGNKFKRKANHSFKKFIKEII